MTTLRPRLLLLLLLLVAGAALLPTAHTEALECSGVQDVTKDNPVDFSLDQQATKSIQFSTPTEGKWDAMFTVGEGTGASFTPRIQLELKKTKPSASYYQIKLSSEETKTVLLNNRVDTVWLEGGGQTTLFLDESALSVAFHKGDSKFLLQFTDPELKGLDVVRVEGDLKVEECEAPGRVPDPTTTTTSEPTTTITTTTTAPTTTVITTSVPTTPTVPTTSVAPTITEATPTTATVDASPSPIMPERNTVTDSGVGVTTVCSTPSNNTVPAVGGVGECQAVPRWAWACAGLAVVFFVFILVLISYFITLYRRSWRSGNPAQGSGGFGMTAQDMHYFEMRNTNLMIGNTVPRIPTPRPPSTPGPTPTNSTSRLSHNFPPSPSPTPNSLRIHSNDARDSMSDITDYKEKSRSSKVSFADD